MIKYTCGAGTPEEAETNCTYFIRGECTASFCEYRMKKQTRADKIRAMSDEELAEWLTEFANEAFAAGAIRFGGALMTEHDRLTWLQQPAAGGER